MNWKPIVNVVIKKHLTKRQAEKIIQDEFTFIEKMERGASYFEVMITDSNVIENPEFFILNNIEIEPPEKLIGPHIKRVFYPKYDLRNKQYIRDFFWEGKFVVKSDKKLAEFMVQKLRKENWNEMQEM